MRVLRTDFRIFNWSKYFLKCLSKWTWHILKFRSFREEFFTKSRHFMAEWIKITIFSQNVLRDVSVPYDAPEEFSNFYINAQLTALVVLFHNWRTVPDVLLPLEHEAPGGAGGEALGPALGADDVSPAALLHRAHRPQPRPALPAQPRLRVHPQQQCTQFMVL